MVHQTIDFLPDEWKVAAKEVASRFLTDEGAIKAAERAICELIDHCAKEAVLLNTAQLLDDTLAADTLSNISAGVFDK